MIEAAILVGLAGAVVYALRRSPRTDSGPASSPDRPPPGFSHAAVPAADDPAVRLQFVNVFAIMTEHRREGLIAMYVRNLGCSRTDAMRKAVLDRQIDADRAY